MSDPPIGWIGDRSGISIDPGDDSFWAVNEFANTLYNRNWGTAIAYFSPGIPAGETDLAVAATGPSAPALLTLVVDQAVSRRRSATMLVHAEAHSMSTIVKANANGSVTLPADVCRAAGVVNCGRMPSSASS